MPWIAILLSLTLSDTRAFTAADLKSGDVLLQSIPCYVCSMIEIEEGAPYSHMGVVLKTSAGISLLQAWGKVQALPLAESLAIRKPHTNTLVLRAVNARGRELHLDTQKISDVFDHEFSNLSYDEAFLWDNRDASGEKLYCSEFAAKFLNRFLPIPIQPKAMHFNQYRDSWIHYFQGMPPDGQPGISPADFLHSPLFKTVGELSSNP
jgi:hypothetical protein